MTGQDKTQFQQNLKEVYAFDRQSSVKQDFPEGMIKQTGTKELIERFLSTDIPVLFTQYSNPNIGIYRASRSCSSLHELLNRDDLAGGFARFFADPRLDVSGTQKSSDPGKLWFALMSAEELLNYPDVASKCKGNERPLLVSVSQEYSRMRATDKGLGKAEFGPDVYQAMGGLATDLIGRLDHAATPCLQTLLLAKKYDAVFDRVADYLKSK